LNVNTAQRASAAGNLRPIDADPITTEVIRHSLGSAAEQMKRALIRTAFSPIIYDVLDFAGAIYDRRFRLLAQAPTLPLFMGTLSFCVEAAVEGCGGEKELEMGDVLLYNWPYGTGSHAQDAAIIMPIFVAGELLGYSAIKAHWLDIGGKEAYSTNTTDVYQEGTFFPSVKLFASGEPVRDVLRIVAANSRVPRAVLGDINAQIVGVRTGADAVSRLVERYGQPVFWAAVERMFDHGEATVRSYLREIPDGRYEARGWMDDDGITSEPIPFDVVVTVAGSDVTVDYTAAPDAQQGPINCPIASTVSGTRIALAALAGGQEPPNEGHFRALRVETRPGSLFDPQPPSPCFLYAWPIVQAIEVIYRALSVAIPERVPAASGGDVVAFSWWGRRRETGEMWVDGAPHPVGQGAHARGDGASSLIHISEAATRFAPAEVWEARNPMLVEKLELCQDSCGPGKYRGGLGLELWFRALDDCHVTASIERTKTRPWGLAGGGEAASNECVLERTDGSSVQMAKITALHVPQDAVVQLRTGGGGGYGPAEERLPEAVLNDVREGYISESHARAHYPHAYSSD